MSPPHDCRDDRSATTAPPSVGGLTSSSVFSGHSCELGLLPVWPFTQNSLLGSSTGQLFPSQEGHYKQIPDNQGQVLCHSSTALTQESAWDGGGDQSWELPNYRMALPVFESFLPAPLPLSIPSPREITLKGPNGTMSSSLPLSSLPLSLSFFFY